MIGEQLRLALTPARCAECSALVYAIDGHTCGEASPALREVMELLIEERQLERLNLIRARWAARRIH